MLRLKLQYFGHLMQRADSLKKTLILERLRAGGKGDGREWDGWMASPTRWTWVWVDSGSWWWTGRPGVQRFMGSQRVGHNWATYLNRTDIDKTVKRRLGENSNGVLCHARFEILFYIMRRKWQPFPVFLPGNPRQDFQRSLKGHSPWGCKRVRHSWTTKHNKTILHQKGDRIYMSLEFTGEIGTGDKKNIAVPL